MPDQEQDSVLQQKLAVLEKTFQKRLQERFHEIGAALKLSTTESEPRQPLTELHRLLHTLAGSAGTFGFVEIGRRAHEFENRVSMLLSGAQIDRAGLLVLGAELREYLAGCPGASMKNEQAVAQVVDAAVLQAANDKPSQPIYIVDDDVLLAQGIALQLEYFGYQVIVVNQLEQFSEEILRNPPAAVVMDMTFGQDGLAGAKELTYIRQMNALKFPSIYISTSSQFEKRLAAVRAGADGYFPKPLDALALSERLDLLTGRKGVEPYRVLIVDDDLDALSFFSVVLVNAGMEVRTTNKPAEILTELSDFKPELVLVDMYMPDCSGVELAKVIRLDNKYLDIPIIFLSGEEDLGKQLCAIESGADDFLMKPIEPAHLISAVTSRGERYRALRSLIMRDGLTRLYNHSAIKEQLSREISAARRAGADLSLAMIDLDFFKRINDNYGHPIGDQVIRALARLLQRRLRRCDIIGRYGGEEFAVIFPATSAAVAKDLLDRTRELFSKIHHHGNGAEFSTSFSAGIVALGNVEDAEAMVCAADAALYRAKEGGRNRVEEA
jgi:diguanylate cyclase (GGDEF)-like protein